MSTLKVDTLQNTSGIEKYLAQAWINFNGTGTIAIRAGGNVSSITDLGTGSYRITYTSTIVDTNYSVVGSSQRATDANLAATRMFSTLATTSVNMYTRTDSDTAIDSFTTCVNIHR